MKSSLHPKLKGLIWIAVVVAFAVLSAIGFSIVFRSIPRSLEDRLGRAMTPFRPAELCHRPESVKTLRALIQRIYPQSPEEKALPISVNVLRNGPVNAFASLGPRIYVFETLLVKSQSPEELAGVLAHEMGHVTERHVLQSLAFKAFTIPFWSLISGPNMPVNPGIFKALSDMKFSRDQEYEADIDGLERLQKAEIDTAALAHFFDRLKDSAITPEILSDHPSSKSRAHLAELYPVDHPKPIMTNDQWRVLRQICED